MKLRRNKKGFTIIELVIVIAVIGILAAVLIPTFVNLTSKANEASDNALVNNLNKALKMEEQEPGHQKAPTLEGAIKDLEDQGYILENLASKSGKDLLWSQSENQFLLNTEGKSGKDYWKIVNAMPAEDNQKYSYYAGKGFKDTNVTAKYGFDAGRNDGIAKVTYVGTGTAQEVAIRTNGGSLTINSDCDTVNHYDQGFVLDIKAIASSSYHEFGHFPKATIAQGRIVVEEKGSIPTVEITAIPTELNPIKVETDKDIVVSASKKVVEQLGSNTLDNVGVKVTNSKADVIIDEKINPTNVDAAGKTAEDLVVITKVATFAQLSEAISLHKPYVMFTDDITYPSASISALNLLYSATIDGDGYTLYGSGKRGSNNTSIALNQTGTELIDVKLANLTIENGSTGGRPVEARGNIRSLSIDNCNIRCTGASGYMQAITIGGNQSTSAKVTIKNSKVYSPVYYGLITFNPVDLLIEGSEFECWSALYLKSPDGSFGSRTSKVTIDGSKLVCHNNNSGYSNNFGAIVFEDGTIDVLVKNSSIDVTENGTASQSAVVFSSGWAEVYGTILKEVNVTFENVTIKGTINDENIQYDDTNVVMIQTGATTNDPTAYLADGSYVTTDGLFYQIKNVKTVKN